MERDRIGLILNLDEYFFFLYDTFHGRNLGEVTLLLEAATVLAPLSLLSLFNSCDGNSGGRLLFVETGGALLLIEEDRSERVETSE
jgi:hypothetical protein